MSRKINLNELIECCELRFNRGSAATWKHRDFNDLSHEIELDTKVNISPNTLKRIFGRLSVNNDYIPQQATMNALVKYGKYNNAAEQITTAKSPNYIKQYRVFLIGLSAIIIAGCGWLLWDTLMQKNELPAHILLKSTEGLLPATALFDLQIPDYKDSLFVTFGDKSGPVYIKPGQKRIAHIYLFPGVFKVTLQSGKVSLSETKVSVRSSKWIGLGFHKQIDLPEHYYEFPAVKTGPDSLFHISNERLFRMGLDTTGRFITRLCNFSPIEKTTDNFIFEATFKNALYEKGIYCNSTQFQISGANGKILFKMASRGCSSLITNILSERTFEGSRINLSQFVLDLGKWNTVKIINHNKHISLFANEKRVFSGSYQKSIGRIKGLFIEFDGNGFVKNCDLKSIDEKSLYHF